MQRTFIRTISVEYVLKDDADGPEMGMQWDGLSDASAEEVATAERALPLPEWFDITEMSILSDEITEKTDETDNGSQK